MNAPRTLRDLAQHALDSHGLSARRLAARAQDRGYEITYTTLSALAAGTYKFRPRPETVRAVAWLAGVPEHEAFTAAGLPVPGPPFADELPPGVDNLSPKARRAVIELLRVLIDEERDGDAEHAAPTKTARGGNPAGARSKSDVALAARVGEPAHGRDTSTGEESQDPGHDAPA